MCCGLRCAVPQAALRCVQKSQPHPQRRDALGNGGALEPETSQVQLRLVSDMSWKSECRAKHSHFLST